MTLEETLNDLLVKLFKDILEIEAKSLITEEFKDISYNDMHIIEAVGIDAVSYTHLTLPTTPYV
mgnify:CR=1 FL=1